MSGTEETVTLFGKYKWELLFDIDNSNNDGVVRRQDEMKILIETSYSELKKSVENETTVGSNRLKLAGTLFQLLNVSVKGNVSSEIRSSYKSLVDYKNEQRNETTKRDTFKIGPHSKLKLYRLVFNGPGVNCVTDILTSTPDQKKKEVEITVSVRQVPVLQDIQVVYTDDSVSRPVDIIPMAQGDNPDINAGFGGSFVWLVPKWTKPVNQGATSLEIAIQGQNNPDYWDLARGTGGHFRYIKMMHHTNCAERITKIGLYRTASGGDNPLENGWQYKSIDINRGRNKDFLYLVWNTLSVDDIL